jgi:uncharacterized protein (DUF1800 family)
MAYDMEAIRPHIAGRFEDMLIASARHPAMLFYLDNARSVGPNSGRGRARDAGLNENYAREVMELHTIGAGAGYSQNDVLELARTLTGWTVRIDGAPDGASDLFAFYARAHEPGSKTVLGRRLPEGEAGGVEALRMLARHPATAKRLAAKLAAHFIADAPPASVASRLERTWLDTGGDLRAVTVALVEAQDAWRPAAQKFRSPALHVAATARALGVGAEPRIGGALLGAQRDLGQPSYFAPSPQGWPDTFAAWTSPDQIVERVEWGRAAAAAAPRIDDPVQRGRDVVGPRLSANTMTLMSRAESVADGMGLLFASPDFMFV